MPFEDLLGRIVTMTIERIGPPGAFLVEPGLHEPPPASPGPRAPGPPTALLPRREVPEGAQVGDPIQVFLYLDSEDRPIATTSEPRLVLGEVTFLEVTAVTKIGAFVDWGLMKELLVPFSLQTQEMRVGERHPVGLFVDDTGRLAGTMRVTEFLQDPGEFREDEWVLGEAWRKTPGVGVFVILEKSFVGLLPEGEPHDLSRGEQARFRVASVLPDGKVELSLRGHAHEELAKDAQALLDLLARPGAPKIGDRSSPEQIRSALGLSKKAFKRATGRLLRERKVQIDGDGWLRLASP